MKVIILGLLKYLSFALIGTLPLKLLGTPFLFNYGLSIAYFGIKNYLVEEGELN
jgi:hypothetical protein